MTNQTNQPAAPAQPAACGYCGQPRNANGPCCAAANRVYTPRRQASRRPQQFR